MNRWKKIKFATVMLGATLCFTSCRPSPVLEQIIYTQDAEEVDEEQEKLDPETQAQESEQIDPETQTQADNKEDTNNEAGAEESKADKKKSSKKIDYDKTANDKGKAKQKSGGGSGKKGTGTGKKDQSKSKKETSEEETTMMQLEEVEETEGKEQSSASQTEGEGKVVGSEDSGDVETEDAEETTQAAKKVVTDGKGNEQEIPEDVHSVTAVGSVASVVEMLGGSGRLVGSSENFVSSSLAKSLCEDVSDGSVASWWSGDGDSGISDSNFKKLLKSAPEVCFEISGQNTFSSSQIKQLEDAGISYMVLPALDSVENLKEMVTIVAKVLDENASSGKSATTIAEKYCDWVDSTLKDVESKTSKVALASLYISDWREDVTYQFTKNYESLPEEACSNGKGSGVAVTWSSAKKELMTTWMSAAGVTNTGTSNGNLKTTEEYYVMPMAHQLFPKFSSSDYTYYSSNIAAGADWFVAQKITDSSYNLLGSKEFPAIIVANSDIKEKIENNWYWQYWGKLSNSSWGFGYTSDDGNVYYSSIGGDYEIYVSPTGIESWADGCLESPLESYWIANKISGKISDSTLKSKIKAFYKEFFGASLSDSQLNKIINP